jgi:cytochrome c biogenesis factor
LPGRVPIKKWKGREDDELRKFQEIAGKSILWGFFFFSAAMFAGAVWAYLAWGAYWLWEPKVIWSFIVWFYFAGAMHAWYVKEWRGTGLAVATIIGFFVVLFTYLGVSMLMKSSHSFVGRLKAPLLASSKLVVAAYRKVRLTPRSRLSHLEL